MGRQAARARRGERAIIQAIAARAAGSPRLRVGIGDDCAVLRPPTGHEVVVTTDLLLETVHFRRDWHTPESAGHRCLARGLSDLAAMGAQPLAAFLSIAVPAALAGGWQARFLDGLLRLAAEARVPLAGGDTAAAPGGPHALFSADIVLLGATPRGRALLRSGARPGDRIYVTGALGGSAAELALLASGRARRLRSLRHPGGHHPQLFPRPRLAAGRRLAALASAAIDISDGLSTDLGHLCAASGVGAVVRQSSLPVHPLALESPDPVGLALHGGEDYELLFTAPPAARVPKSLRGLPIHAIGEITAQPGIRLARPRGRTIALRPAGWEHFRSHPFPKRPPGPD